MFNMNNNMIHVSAGVSKMLQTSAEGRNVLQETACTLSYEQVTKVLVSFVILITVPQESPKRACHLVIASLVTNLLQQLRSKTHL